MARIKVIGDTIVATSTLKLEDIKRVEKYDRQVLTVMGGEKKDTPVFVVGTTTGKGGMNKYGVSFSGATHDDNKFAFVSMALPAGISGAEAVKEYIADEFSVALAHLGTIEEAVPAALEQINTARDAVKAGIEIE